MGVREFPLAWGWTQESHSVLPESNLSKLSPLAADAARAVHEKGSLAIELATVASTYHFSTSHEADTREWLRSITWYGATWVYVCWDEAIGMSLPWSVFIQYWEDFCYLSSDDALIFSDGEAEILRWNHDGSFEIFRDPF